MNKTINLEVGDLKCSLQSPHYERKMFLENVVAMSGME